MLPRVEQAVALLALLELRKSGEIDLSQAAPFAPIRVSKASRSSAAPGPAERRSALPAPRGREEGIEALDSERILEWTARSA